MTEPAIAIAHLPNGETPVCAKHVIALSERYGDAVSFGLPDGRPCSECLKELEKS